MAIKIKTPEQIELMRRSGKLLRRILDHLGEIISPGITTEELNAEAEGLTLEAGAECLFKGVPGKNGPFPGCLCTSINEEVVHGIPGSREICDGDILSIDFGVRLDGWCSDAAETHIVGDVSPDVRRLVDVTRQSLVMVVEMAKPGIKWSGIAGAIQDFVESEGFSIVREFVGHGIGSDMHEDPKVPNFVSGELLARDIVLSEGMVLAVEPMVNMGTASVEYARDGWTVLTRDRLPSAHFEHTVAITASGTSVLTDGR